MQKKAGIELQTRKVKAMESTVIEGPPEQAVKA